MPGDHGARGDFSERAHDRSLQTWGAEHRSVVLGVTAASAAAAALAMVARGRRR
ncbi:MAG: hypothetical protein FWF90_05635 [Promicromonosporaceae bacterium]|nr:hypothetical protein [Promicromonosporaceae bacterium]